MSIAGKSPPGSSRKRKPFRLKLLESRASPEQSKAGIVVMLTVMMLTFVLEDTIAYDTPVIRRANIPEPHTISELRNVSHLSPMEQCDLPRVAQSSDWRAMAAPDGELELTLPIPWRFKSMDTTNSVFQYPEAAFMDRRDSYIAVRRIAYGGVTRTFMRDSVGVIKPQRECEISNDVSGTIWSFYSLPRPNGEIRYQGLADAVTSSGRRYGITVLTWTAANRDSLAAMLADAIIRQ